MSTLPVLPSETEGLTTYAYSYPHKSSYRPLSPPVSLDDVWRDEEVSRLALYLHLPFCEMRCGFCNLFTESQPADDVVDGYLQTLHRQMLVVRSRLPAARFAQFAIGGGTPTFLAARQIESLLESIETTFHVSIRQMPTSVETSPATATVDRLRVLSAFGVQRISLGVQSFLDAEAHHIGRPQRVAQVHAALDSIRQLSFPILNIDLIYGDPEQTQQTWLSSLTAALRYRPEELYLYPLYVRPDTGLGRTGKSAARHRVDLYRCGRDFLLSSGYEQMSLRCFRQGGASVGNDADYACQQYGMLGLGCGARSYTQQLHYATRFAVSQAGVRAILRDWIAQTDADLALATHGLWLSGEEQRRRFLILSLLQADGLLTVAYRKRFDSEPALDIPELSRLESHGWIAQHGERIVLTEAGLENSDEVGPMLYSHDVRERLREFVQA